MCRLLPSAMVIQEVSNPYAAKDRVIPRKEEA